MRQIHKHIRYFKTDPKGEIAFIVEKFHHTLYAIYSQIACKMILNAKGIKYKKGIRFRGRILISRHQNSIIHIGQNCTFNSSSYFNYRGLNHRCILQTGTEDAQIIIGDNCGFSGVSIVADIGVIIGNNTKIGANTRIGDRDDHPEIYASQPQRIIIEDNVWIGMNVTIMKGVTIGKNSIIGAGAIVTKDIPANVIAAGIPCKVIKARL
ncbi:DapH/DapD/GlmU-related protein [Mediterranea massiliensis]|uniref:acyltransferase n=1 Tax=Mediterranea massiliensis TaxID=1841865 RepID=UPI0023F28A48|nr:DapH/DapD/GlmU-related protein [Mediterranea massiliensis]